MSFNRVWPGYQRDAGSQTDLVSFVNIVSDEELDFKVEPLFEYEKIMIKPYSKNISHTLEDKKVSFKRTQEGQYVFLGDNFHHTLYIFNSRPIASPKKEDVTYTINPSYKEIKDKNAIEGTNELEICVGDFEKTNLILNNGISFCKI